MHAKLANIVAPNEVVINTTFQIEFGPIGGALNVCIPYSMIEPIRDLLSNPLQDEIEVDKRWVKQLSQQVQSAEVELRAHFLTLQSSIGQLLRLQAGDVLPVEHPGNHHRQGQRRARHGMRLRHLQQPLCPARGKNDPPPGQRLQQGKRP
jgi:flagellar motor switch protein FliM